MTQHAIRAVTALIAPALTAVSVIAQGDSPRIEAMVVKRGACFGSCAVYTLGIDRHGVIHLQQSLRGGGIHQVVDTVRSPDVEKLFGAAERASLFSVSPRVVASIQRCAARVGDLPDAGLVLYTTGRSKEFLNHRGSCEADSSATTTIVRRLSEIESEIDRVAGVGSKLLHERVASAEVDSGHARFMLGSATAGALLYVNAKIEGPLAAPRWVTVLAGPVRVELRAQNCRSWDTTFVLQEGQSVRIGRRNLKC